MQSPSIIKYYPLQREITQPPNSNSQAMRHSSKIHIVSLTTRNAGEHIVVGLSGWGEGLQAAHYALVVFACARHCCVSTDFRRQDEEALDWVHKLVKAATSYASARTTCCMRLPIHVSEVHACSAHRPRQGGLAEAPCPSASAFTARGSQ